ADVVKVEDTAVGDYARMLDANPGAPSAFYGAINRGKRSVALDLKRDAGRAAFMALARSADVVVESFRPGVVAALGVDYTALAALVGAARGGRGRYIDVAMADASLAHNVFALHALEQRGAVAARGDDLLTGGVPCYGVYATADGRFLAVGALETKFWSALCNA